MTKEELKKEAEESFEQYKVTDEDYVVSPYSDDMGEKMLMYNYEYYAEETYLRLYTQGYLAGAEPREKQIQIDAEQIRALQKQNGELTDKVKKLEAEVREWKDKADLWCKTANLKDHNIMINKELQEENAELKEDNSEWEKASDKWKSLYELTNNQLTNAKEIIKAFLDSSDLNIKHKAEEFLGEF